ncbi:MAG: MFS transporter [Gammaproteobacteria bacterium]|nr:MFS transporter [Gammaproteobacteria bacterium]
MSETFYWMGTRIENDSIKKIIATNSMTSFQIQAVGICLLINFLDGFDVLAIAFAAPTIAREWSIGATSLGVVFSSGLAGMVIGALVLSPFADRIGRRPMILTCLLMISAGMLLSAAVETVSQLVMARILTGLGVGGMLSSLTTMVAEYSSAKRRQLAISIMQSGYPVGAIIAGFVSAWLLGRYGWRSIFAFGGLLSLSLIPLVYLRLPESIDFLLTRPGKNTLPRVNDVLARLGHSTLRKLPAASLASEPVRYSGLGVFQAAYLYKTIAIWIAFTAMFSAFYFVTNWTPKILIDAGLSRDIGIGGGVLIAMGGTVGGLTLGWLSGRFQVHLIGAVYMLLGFTSMIVFGLMEFQLTAMLSVAFMIGFFLAGAIICLYTILPGLYPTEFRNTGAGWALGVGRLGAVIGPYIAGILISAGWERGAYYAALSLPLVLSFFAVLWLRSAATRVD